MSVPLATTHDVLFHVRQAKRYAKQRAEDNAKEKVKLYHAVMLLQSAYRGHQGRCSVLLKFQAYFKVQEEQKQGATHIQRIVRGRQTRVEVDEAKRVKFEEVSFCAFRYGPCLRQHNFNSSKVGLR